MVVNFRRYFSFILRREKISGTAWLISLAAFAALLTAMFPGLFPNETALHGMAATMNTPAMVALMGPVYGLEAYTPAMAMAQECLIWFAIAVIIMNIFFISRHTRADEELGRLEMFAALPVGRLTGSVSSIVSAFLMNMAAAVLIALFSWLLPLEGSSAAGSFAYGLSIGMQGFVFAAVTLLMAQLFSTARGCVGMSFAVMGVSYALRAGGDIAGNALSIISPMGLGLQVEAFYRNDFMPVIGLFVEGIVITAIALAVNRKRDVGMGVFPARKGRAQASCFLRSPLGLAWRMTRNGLAAWAAGLWAMGLVYGAVIDELERFVEGNDMIRQILQGGSGTSPLVDAYIAMLNAIVSLLITIPLINAVNRLGSEEKRGRMEVVLASAVSRRKVFGGYVLIAVIAAPVLSVFGALGLYAGAGGAGTVSLAMLVKAALLYVPALLVMIGLAALLTGCIPRLSGLVWVVYGYSFLMFYFGRLLEVPEWMIKITPYGNIAQVPVQEVAVEPLVILSIIAVILGTAGFIGYQRRDSGR